jgi:hypothetical protein
MGVQIDLFDTKASLSAEAQTTSDGVHHAAVSGSGSLVAPIPVAGSSSDRIGVHLTQQGALVGLEASF